MTSGVTKLAVLLRAFGLRAFGVLAFGVLAPGSIGCHGHGSDAPDPTVEDVTFVAPATDEALLRLLDLPAQDLAVRRMVVASPSAGAVLSKDAPATIEFHLAGSAAAAPAGRPRAAPRRVGQRRARLEGLDGWLDELLKLVGPIRAAHAHGAPLNGNGYFVVIADAAGAPRLRVFTNQTSYPPSLPAWAALAAAPQPMTLSITWATFEDNEVTADGGPFVGGSVQLQIR